jgi:hypothetical protein
MERKNNPIDCGSHVEGSFLSFWGPRASWKDRANMFVNMAPSRMIFGANSFRIIAPTCNWLLRLPADYRNHLTMTETKDDWQ